MVAVFAYRRPSCEQRPHRAEVISAGIVSLILRRNNSHAPICFVVLTREEIEGGLSLGLVKQIEPHWYGRKDAGNVESFVGRINAKTKEVLVSGPENLIQLRLTLTKSLLEVS